MIPFELIKESVSLRPARAARKNGNRRPAEVASAVVASRLPSMHRPESAPCNWGGASRRLPVVNVGKNAESAQMRRGGLELSQAVRRNAGGHRERRSQHAQAGSACAPRWPRPGASAGQWRIGDRQPMRRPEKTGSTRCSAVRPIAPARRPHRPVHSDCPEEASPRHESDVADNSFSAATRGWAPRHSPSAAVNRLRRQ